jgi:hypothetical protein
LSFHNIMSFDSLKTMEVSLCVASSCLCVRGLGSKASMHEATFRTLIFCWYGHEVGLQYLPGAVRTMGRAKRRYAHHIRFEGLCFVGT